MEPIRILGTQAVTLPDFADREDLARGFLESEKSAHRSIMRIYSAYLGLCTPLGKAARMDGPRGDVDGDTRHHSLRLRRAKRAAEHPAIERGDEAALLRNGDELRRR